jgi:hypothetical protein
VGFGNGRRSKDDFGRSDIIVRALQVIRVLLLGSYRVNADCLKSMRHIANKSKMAAMMVTGLNLLQASVSVG